MLCQNCKKNEASLHLKRIVNGEAGEIHLCGECAASVGYNDIFPGFGLPFAAAFGRMFGDGALSATGNRVLRCETCGFSFEDITRTGLPGCPDCYKVFYDKLLPAVQKIHGRAVYAGKIPSGANEAVRNERRIKELSDKLNKAIDEQNFEVAAQLRDEIRRIASKRDGN